MRDLMQPLDDILRAITALEFRQAFFNCLRYSSGTQMILGDLLGDSNLSKNTYLVNFLKKQMEEEQFYFSNMTGS